MATRLKSDLEAVIQILGLIKITFSFGKRMQDLWLQYDVLHLAAQVLYATIVKIQLDRRLKLLRQGE